MDDYTAPATCHPHCVEPLSRANPQPNPLPSISALALSTYTQLCSHMPQVTLDGVRELLLTVQSAIDGYRLPTFVQPTPTLLHNLVREGAKHHAQQQQAPTHNGKPTKETKEQYIAREKEEQTVSSVCVQLYVALVVGVLPVSDTRAGLCKYNGD